MKKYDRRTGTITNFSLTTQSSSLDCGRATLTPSLQPDDQVAQAVGEDC